jgi:hypothetical protein
MTSQNPTTIEGEKWEVSGSPFAGFEWSYPTEMPENGHLKISRNAPTAYGVQGVPSSDLGVPTNFFKHLRQLTQRPKFLGYGLGYS